MFRKRGWRKAASEAVSWHQDESLNATVFILKEFGPTGFLRKEDGEPKNYKVSLQIKTSGNVKCFREFQVSFNGFRCFWVILTPALVEPSRKRRTSANTSAGNPV